MTAPKVFIASSSEGLDVTKTVRGLLLDELTDRAEVKPWTLAFELSATYIESLEKAAREMDFAVVVLTPDDTITSREAEKLAPRDNILFELGLFIGSLGRERCFLVHEKRPDLKLPTDLLGVKAATFDRPANGDLRTALDPQCFRISERIAKLGTRHKLSTEALAVHAAMRGFYDRIEGAWWERITVAGKSWVSFLQIEFDDIYDSVHLRGRSYDKEGSLTAHWKSVVVRIVKDEKKVLYHWQGWYPASPNERFHGFGEMEFEGSATGSETINRGQGKYWDVDEAHPERTVIKPVELRRILDKTQVSTMAEGKETERRPLVVKTLDEW